MNVVLPFPTDRRPLRETLAQPVMAEIVIFPGVRFERRNFDTPKPATVTRQHRNAQAAIEEDMA
jgi:hypothetical protein